jgi:hypothetical protein
VTSPAGLPRVSPRTRLAEVMLGLPSTTFATLMRDGFPRELTNMTTRGGMRPHTGHTTATPQGGGDPPCAWNNWISEHNLTAEGADRSSHSCDPRGVPITQ